MPLADLMDLSACIELRRKAIQRDRDARAMGICKAVLVARFGGKFEPGIFFRSLNETAGTVITNPALAEATLKAVLRGPKKGKKK